MSNRRSHRALSVLLIITTLCGMSSGLWVSARLLTDITRLPVGDGKRSTQPRQGALWGCQTHFGGGGAFRDGPWIHDDGTWDATTKIAVRGAVAWPASVFAITVEGETRRITGNALPTDHTTGVYPVASSDPAFEYDRNPNSIRPSPLTYILPTNPIIAEQPSCLPLGAIGVTMSGVVLFNGVDALGRDAQAHEIQDQCGGHPERTGRYHYHSLSPCLDDPGTDHSYLVGYALDGFGIYGYRGEDGSELTDTDLDECHGHTHEIDWDGSGVVMYHYHATREYPYTLGCFRGTPFAP